MYDADPLNVAVKVSQQANDFLSNHKLSPNPVNFMVAYAIVKEERKSLLQAYQQRLANDQLITEFTMRELFDMFFSCSNEEELKRQYGDLQGLLMETIHEMQSATSANDDFGQMLNSHLDDLKADPSPADIMRINYSMISSTERICKSSSELTQHLLNAEQEALELRGELERTKDEASLDGLTGLLNRKTAEVSLQELIEQSALEQSPLAALMLDIDHFKGFNDNFGHLVGDEVLRCVGSAIKNSVRGTDVSARYGGEEFIVLLPATPIEGAVRVAETIRVAVQKLRLVRKANKQRLPTITISLGVASYRPEDSAESLIKRCDDALYLSKNNGRNRVSTEVQL